MIDVLSPRNLLALGAVAVLTAAGAGCASEPGKAAGAAPERTPVSASAPSPTPTEAGVSTPTEEPIGAPATIEIEEIDVAAGIVGVGLADDGSMETPPYDSNLAGWYIEGPEPGQPGPSVVVAHVDHPGGGPDTFARLDELEVGDEIMVADTLGEEHEFVVTDTEQVDKDGLPYERIWPETSEPLLALITCDGPYVGGEYEDNFIVYAEEAG